MKRKLRLNVLIIMLLIAASLVITACSPVEEDPTPAKTGDSTTDVKELKIGVVNTGTAETMAWTRAHKEGIDYLEEQMPDLDVIWVEDVPDAGPDCAAVIDTLVEEGCNLIFTTSFGFMAPTQDAAKKYPDVMFYHNQSTTTAENLGVYDVRDYEAVFLTGYLAAKVAAGDVYGYVGTNPMPTVIRAANAFALGVRHANSEANLKAVFTNSWYDVTAERESAISLLDEGASALGMQVSSPAVVQAAQERDKFSVGFSDDMSVYAPESVLTSFKWNWGPLYVHMVEGFIDGTLTTGQDLFFGLEEGCGGISGYNTALVSEEIISECDALFEDLKSGEVKVFHGEIKDNQGNVYGESGEDLSYDEIRSMDWLVDFMSGTVG